MKEIWRKQILQAKLPRVLTIIGGGGKTSLLYYLLALLKACGYPAIGATTTKLSRQHPPGHCFVEITKLVDGYQAMEKVGEIKEYITLVYGKDPTTAEKMLGVPGEWIDQLGTRYQDIILVVEGDGSAGKSLKGHLGHEPVIPKTSSLVIVVIGIDSVGAKLTAQYVHRPVRVSELIGSIPNSIVTTDMITQLLFHPQGYLHNCPGQSEIIIFINKVESPEDEKKAEKLGKEIIAYQHSQIRGVMIGSMEKEVGRWLSV